MRWIIGIDAPRRSPGALQFARWLANAGAVERGRALFPVRVLDDEHLRLVLRRHHLDEVVEAEREEVARLVGALLPAGCAAPEVVRARTTAEGLEEARARHDAAGIIVARAAPRRSHRPFRLGSVARALLRGLASPVLVVPPDLTASVGDGAIVATSSLGAESVRACRLARSIADEAHRDLAIVHVHEERRGPAASDATASLDAVADPYARAGDALARWVAHHGVWAELTAVLEGDLRTATLGFAEARRAPLLAVTARAPAGLRTAIEPQAWRWIAAHASLPVLVVPPSPAEGAAASIAVPPDLEDGVSAGPA